MKKLYKVFFDQSFKELQFVLAYLLFAGMLQSCENGRNNEALTVGENGEFEFYSYT